MLTGKSLQEGESLLEEADLTLQVLDSAVFNPKLPPLSILDQNPRAGSRVKPGREIKVTINPLKARKVQLPELIDKTLRRAVFDLESKNLKVGKSIYKPYLARDVVLDVLMNGKPISAGTWVEPGTEVQLVLGQGLGGESVPYPNVLGMTLAQARQALASASLTIGGVVYDADEDTLQAKVYRQVPDPRLQSDIQMGETVDLMLSVDGTKIPDSSLE